MKNLAKIAVVLTALASCAAFAQSDNDADRARRERNMDEVLAKHHVNLDRMGSDTESTPESRPTLRARSHRVAEKTREKTHHAAATTREETHEAAQSTRDFTHRQADKVRKFTDRQNARSRDKNDRAPAKKAEGTS